jgi:hypothetical protein
MEKRKNKNQSTSPASAPLKRFPIKYIRDKAKSAYVKEKECYICGDSGILDLHHFNSISQLFNIWSKANNITIINVDDIVECRDDFIEAHRVEIYEEVRTLCKKHHKQLHSLYGQHPKLTTAIKQSTWCDKQKIKLQG